MTNNNPVQVDVIVPVYDGFEETRDCIESVLASSNAVAYELLVVWDVGPDQALLAYLKELDAAGAISLLENEQNQGFVRTVNRAMKVSPERDVVLLNSDTLVANNWLDRLHKAATTGHRTASVTPFSNNAEICSFPRFCESSELPAGWDVARMDRLFSEKVSSDLIPVPTGVGFCMYITREALLRVGYFDAETFGRGYGEENDFCQRAIAVGYSNYLLTNTFVYHAGGVSFGSEKEARIQNALTSLDRLHPDYQRQVQNHIARDPACGHRLQAAFEWLRGDSRPKVLVFSHGLGGGTVKHIEELAAYLREQAVFLFAKSVRYDRLDVMIDPLGIEFSLDMVEEREALAGRLLALGICHIHVHHISGLEPSIRDLVDELGISYDVTLHDYFFINGNPTLTDVKGNYVGLTAEQDDFCAGRYPSPLGMDAADWRDYIRPFLQGAVRVFCPSEATRDIYQNFFPDLNYLCVGHPEERAERSAITWHASAPGKDETLRVAVLGALSPEKGADVLESTAQLARRRGLSIEFHLVGYAYRPLDDCVRETGAYRDEQLDGLIAGVDPHLMWFPCLWPETYSYTLSTALNFDIPILAPDIGAFTERLAANTWCRVVGVSRDPAYWLTEIGNLVDKLPMEKSARWSRSEQGNFDFCYRSDYCQPFVPPVERELMNFAEIQKLSRLPDDQPEPVRAPERVLRRLQQFRLMRRLQQVIPPGLRARLKNLLFAQ